MTTDNSRAGPVAPAATAPAGATSSTASAAVLRHLATTLPLRPPRPAAARASAGRVRQAYESLSAGVVVTDPTGLVLDVNPAYETLLRRPRELLVGRVLQDVVLTAEGRFPLEDVVRHLLTGGGALVCEALVRRPDGTTFPGRATVALARIDGGTVVVTQLAEDDEQHRRAADQLHRTGHDPLTGLRDRAALLEELGARLAAPGPPLALLVCDLDRFRVLNTDLGHEGADEVLVTAARRLLGAVRGGDVVARLGGDEFAVVVDGLAGPLAGAALEAAGRLTAVLGEPMRVDGREVGCAAGVGVAVAERGAGRAPESRALLRDAGTALREAKSAGPGTVRLFRPVMRERVLGRLELENGLRRALARGELEVHYQPVVRLADGTRTGFEALVRWRHPQRGLLLPEDFLPVAGEAGLAAAVDAFVLERALDLLQRRPGVRVAVNTCATRFDGTFADEVAAGLRRRGVAPGRLVVELLEHSLLSGDTTTVRELARLAEEGVGVAIDDFGTGYSALAYLQHLPVTSLKLDRALVADLPEDAAADRIAAAVAGLARGLGLVAVAEGVETVAQAVRLRAQGWEFAQGWFYGRPAPEQHWYPAPRGGTIGWTARPEDPQPGRSP
ncbi:putative bifunctional diguanylate cyclase/phosphodiesterase [Kineococcus indalonis]|uniref:putative bifunctional diguanylate cyclase/phosphodiesterase n=1 Tax=Kineococcus indalonis TaxID=2696566 RepID=UPI00196AC210|nr:EAL domain-containing protein [Kineococcus indalonis]NAZ87577.1 EAL domain-containing protein [Kineococcus indalonis]